MSYINGVNLLPSTGEFTYDTIPYLGQRVTEATLTSINRYANGGPLAGTGSITFNYPHFGHHVGRPIA